MNKIKLLGVKTFHASDCQSAGEKLCVFVWSETPIRLRILETSYSEGIQRRKNAICILNYLHCGQV